MNDFAVGIAGEGDGVGDGEDGPGLEDEVVGLLRVSAQAGGEGTDGVVEAEECVGGALGGGLGGDGAGFGQGIIIHGGSVAWGKRTADGGRRTEQTEDDTRRREMTGADREKS